VTQTVILSPPLMRGVKHRYHRAGHQLRELAGSLSRRLRPLLALSVATACSERVASRTFVEPSTGREYRVIARADHDPKRPAPALFALHGYATHPDVVLESFSLAEKAVDERGMLLVVPLGKKDDHKNAFWNASHACCGETKELPDDVAYLRGVLTDLSTHFAVERERVYALGVSNGGFMAHRWACTPGGDLRGIVVIAGMGPGPGDPACEPSVPVRVLQIHGDADDVVRYEGGQGIRGAYPSAPATVQRWQTLNLCAPPLPEKADWSMLHGTVRKARAVGPAAEVQLWTFEGGGHYLRALRFLTADLLDFLEQR
jgi:polyhydroxybutyrate depolymerase